VTIARLRLPFVVAAVIGATALFASGGGASIADSAPSNTSAPVITGTLQQGQTLQTSSGGWAGTTPMAYTYQWQRCDSHGNSCSFISGAKRATYTLASADVGHTIRSFVTAKNSAGTGTGQSNHSSVVSGAAAPNNTSLPAISGTAVVGGTLTTSNGEWEGSSPFTYAYTWRRCDTNGGKCNNIDGASKTTYTLVNDDQGHTIRVSVRATNSVGQSTATSNATSVVTAGAPANTVAPTISGTPAQGQTLTANNGTWTGASPITYTYSWERCDASGNNCAAINAATAQTYVLAAQDVAHKLRVNVTAKNGVGSNHVESSVVGPIASSTSGTPSGTAVPASSISDSDRLTISSIKYAPGPFHGRGPITATIKVIDENNHPVSGVLVYVLPTPLNFANHPAEVPTGANGTATVQLTLTAKAPKSGGLILFIRARTPQGNILAGSSSRRLVQVKIFAK
jgi:hypothetical protein